MKVSEFLGKTVLDKNAVEVGKVSDMDLEPQKCIVNSILISTGELGLTRKIFAVNESEIDRIGDYVVLTLEKAELDERIEGSAEKAEEKITIKLEKSD